MANWSNLSKVVYKRTYSRKTELGGLENWEQTVDRVIRGNVRNHNVSSKEIERLKYFMTERKATPAGRGLWFSGTDAHANMGGIALCNCWGLTADDWMAFVIGQDLLMLGGGVGMSVEHRYTSKLPKVKKNVTVVHKATKDADFIVPDSREGWCELTRRVLESFFVTGKSFSYSTVCIRPPGEPISGFGGTSAGARPLIVLVEKLGEVLRDREGKNLRPIDAADVLCSIGEMVVAGNIRRSALMILGDGYDKDFLKAKRWDLGPIPTQRAMANWSVVCDDVEDLHPLFWKTYEHGEAFGIVNVKNIQKFGRMGELKKDGAVVVNPCVPGYVRLLTKDGYRRIDSLVGKSVDIWNGFEWSTVTPQITGYDQPLVEVELSSGQFLVCTEAHKFVLSTDYKGSEKRVCAVDLTEGDKLIKSAFPILKGGTVPEHDAYTQGFWSGDGTSGTRQIHLYGEKVQCAGRLVGDLGSYSQAQDRTHFCAKSIEPDKEFVPFDWNLQGRLDWLAGLVDSDGTELKEGGVQIGSIEKGFLLNVQAMLTTMGVASKVTVMNEAGMKPLPDGNGGTKDYPCQTCYRLLVGSVQMQNLKELGYKGTRLTFDKKPQRDASRFVQVVAVRRLGVEPVVYCFNEPKRHLGCFDGVVTGQCGEATLEAYEQCNLQEIALPNLSDEEEFVEAARLMHRWGKRVTLERFHWDEVDEVVKRNRRVGTGITGCMQSSLFNPKTLDRAYAAIQEENVNYSKELGIPQSIRTTVIKPSGSISKCLDVKGEGLHGGFSRYMIQRIRFSATDPLIPMLREAGHHIEPVIRFDNTFDHNTLVVDFYEKMPDELPVADEGWDTWKQLDVLKLAQKHWADQAVSVTVYYRKEEISQIKAWLALNLKYLKTISFLCHNDHGFKQAPKEAITKEEYEKFIEKISEVDVDKIGFGDDVSGSECEGGSCPIK